MSEQTNVITDSTFGDIAIVKDGTYWLVTRNERTLATFWTWEAALNCVEIVKAALREDAPF